MSIILLQIQATRSSTKSRIIRMCFGSVSSFCATCGTRYVTCTNICQSIIYYILMTHFVHVRLASKEDQLSLSIFHLVNLFDNKKPFRPPYIFKYVLKNNFFLFNSKYKPTIPLLAYFSVELIRCLRFFLLVSYSLHMLVNDM